MEIAALITSIATFLVALLTCIFTYLIPKRIMVNQLFADLVAEYRTPEMGGAILALFHFYNEYSKKKELINSEYEKLYDEQITKKLKDGEKVDYANTLHFQRRLVAQFYASMGDLCSKYSGIKLLRQKIDDWFTDNEITLLEILLELHQPASNVFIKINNTDDSQKNIPMYKAISEILKQVKRLRSCKGHAAISDTALS